MSEEEKIGKLTLGEIRALEGELKNMIENAVAGEIRSFEQEHGIEVADASVFFDRETMTANGPYIETRFDISVAVKFRKEAV